jgi:hypothetical protein
VFHVRYGCVSDCVRAIKFALSLGNCSEARRRMIDKFPQRGRKMGVVQIVTGFKLKPEAVELGVLSHIERRAECEALH